MSEKNQNPLTENIGGGDDSQNRFEKVRIILIQDNDMHEVHWPEYITEETFCVHFNKTQEKHSGGVLTNWITIGEENLPINSLDQALEFLSRGKSLIVDSYFPIYGKDGTLREDISNYTYQPITGYKLDSKYFVEQDVK